MATSARFAIATTIVHSLTAAFIAVTLVRPALANDVRTDNPGPTIQVTLSRTNYRIKIDPTTGEPQMPADAVASAQLQNWPAGRTPPATFEWHVTLEWNYPKYPTHHDIANQVFEEPGPLHIDFGPQVSGGLLTVAARATLDGHEIVGKGYAHVLGENPTHEMVLRAFPRNRFGLIASKIGMAESSFQQFTTTCGDDPGGLPYLSLTNDIGIMQLNAPTGSVTTANQVWDWRANVLRGLQVLAAKGRYAVLASRSDVDRYRLPDPAMEQFAYMNVLRLVVGLSAMPTPVVPSLSDTSGSGTVREDPDVDHLRLTQSERDMIRRYNGGSEYACVLTLQADAPYPASIGWEIDPMRGGIQPMSGDPDYVRHVLRAHSGLTLTPLHQVQSNAQPKAKWAAKPITSTRKRHRR